MSHSSSIDPAPTRWQPARLDLDRDVEDTLVLTTVDGGEDYLLSDLTTVPDTAVTSRHPAAVAVRLHGPSRAIHGIRPYSSAAILLPGRSHQEPDLEPLVTSLQRGILNSFSSDQTLRFRVGHTDSALRKQVIGRVVSSVGWINDPTGWDINLTTGPAGWLVEIGALHYSRRFGRLERRPWSTTPMVAEVLIRLAQLTPGSSVHDPCCGTATLLIVAHRHDRGARLTGTDHDPATLAIADVNVARHQVGAELVLGDATPFRTESATLDRVVANLPFGKQVGSHQTNMTLYPAVLNEIARSLTRAGRAVLLTEDKTLLRHAVQRTKGLKLIKERMLRYNGATPTAFVLGPTRR